MKILKSLRQRDFIVDMGYHNPSEMNDLMEEWVVESPFRDYEYRIFARYCKEVRVIYDRVFESYAAVVILNDEYDNREIHIII